MKRANGVTQTYLLRRYGPTLTITEVAQALNRSRQTVYNRISRGTFPIRSTEDGARGRRFDYRDVARYLEQRRKA